MNSGISIKALVVAIVATISVAGPALASPTLECGISCNDGPRIDHFQDLVTNDSRTPCEARNSLPRLLNVARNETLRKVVWQRMLKQELRWVDERRLKHIEEFAVACEMPIK